MMAESRRPRRCCYCTAVPQLFPAFMHGGRDVIIISFTVAGYIIKPLGLAEEADICGAS